MEYKGFIIRYTVTPKIPTKLPDVFVQIYAQLLVKFRLFKSTYNRVQ